MPITLENIKKLESTNTLKSWRETINQIRDFLATLATKNHASDNKEFGGASDKLYGHVMLLDKEDSEFVKQIRENGNKVIHAHISEGKDFYTYEPDEHWDCIISNPPFTNKAKIFERAIFSS
jgi:hypothetical protein